MRRFLVLAFFSIVVFLAISATAQVQIWKIDPNHTAAQFSVRHMGISTVRGAFTKVSGTVDYDPTNLSKTSIDATIEATSVDTRVEMRDNDLRSANWLDVAKFPTLTFKSKSVQLAGEGKLKITGDLTIHGVTKEVVLDVDGPSAPVTDPRGTSHVGASATTKIQRTEFGVGTNPVVGDDITITIDTELVRPAAGK
ncbi:MAG TPA: YceI family protein [Candidatus Binatia bacterium]|nr:YceI family protein [Candidatus Binatia bacterium]